MAADSRYPLPYAQGFDAAPVGVPWHIGPIIISHRPRPANGEGVAIGGSCERPRAAAGVTGGYGLRACRACGQHSAAKERQNKKAKFSHDAWFFLIKIYGFEKLNIAYGVKLAAHAPQKKTPHAKSRWRCVGILENILYNTRARYYI
jgi:hypothetical protein